MASTRQRYESDIAIHPGEMLAEEIEARGITQKSLAEVMGRPPQLVNEIVHGKKAITAETALQLERALDIPAYLWLAKQSRYDLQVAREAQRRKAH